MEQQKASNQEKRPILRKSDAIWVGIIIIIAIYSSHLYNQHYFNNATCTVTEPSQLEMWETYSYNMSIKDIPTLKTETGTPIFERTKKGLKFTDMYKLEIRTNPDTRRVHISCKLSK